jgi:hypothetical protein
LKDLKILLRAAEIGVDRMTAQLVQLELDGKSTDYLERGIQEVEDAMERVEEVVS